MGTSSSSGGPGGGTPLVPTWLAPDAPGTPGPLGPTPAGPVPAAPADRPLPQPAAESDRFSAARSNLSRFASSGGGDRRHLGRAVARYVSNSSGGAGTAARRMGASRRAGAGLLGFLSDARDRGTGEALRALNLEALAGRPVEDIFLGLADYLCPTNGSVDAGIARDAFIETTADLAAQGVTDLDALNADQIQTVFELYATHTIEARICNDIGMRVVMFPTNVASAQQVQDQLRDFIRRGVSDALTAARSTVQILTADRVTEFVNGVYQTAFEILRALGEAEGEAE